MVVARELLAEVGRQVDQIRYFQPLRHQAEAPEVRQASNLLQEVRVEERERTAVIITVQPVTPGGILP